jgi:hypothetical protein
MVMDSTARPDLRAIEATSPVNAVLAEVTCTWDDGQTTAAVVHSHHDVLVLEASDSRQVLPPVGTPIRVSTEKEELTGRLAEHGRGARFLVSLGDRPVRRTVRLKVSLPGMLRSPSSASPLPVEIVDLTTGGARVRGIELPVGSQVTLEFIPPFRDETVSVRAIVAHGTHRAERPWIGVIFRLVAMRGGVV